MRTHAVHPTPGQIRDGRLGFVAGWLLIAGSVALVAGPVAVYAVTRWWNGLTPARQADIAAVAGRLPTFVALLAVSAGVAVLVGFAFDALSQALHPRGER